MTLVLASNFGAGIAVMTSDTREVFRGYWLDTETGTYSEDEDDSFTVSEEKHLKTQFLTDYVLMGTAGISNLCRFFLDEMAKLVQKDDDLEDCQRILMNLIQECKRKAGSNPLFSFLNQENQMMVILNGFKRSGEGGLVIFNAGAEKTGEILETPQEGSRWTMTAADKYQHLGKDLVELPDNFDGQALINRTLTVHAMIAAEEPVIISPECHCYLLFYHEGATSNFQIDFDTSVWFEHLKQLESK